MHRNTQFWLVIIALVLIASPVLLADQTTGNTQTQNVVVNVTIPQGIVMVPPGALFLGEKTHSIGLGISSPIYGTEHNVIRNGETYTEMLTGINLLLGYTWRSYLGEGLPQQGGSFYWEFMTIGLIVPMIGAGYEYRVNKAFRIGIGFPDMLSVRISL